MTVLPTPTDSALRSYWHYFFPIAVCGVCSCGDVSVEPDAGRAPDAAMSQTGTFRLVWSTSDGFQDVSCSDIGALSVRVQLIQNGSFAGEAEAFGCVGGEGTSRGITAGVYQVTIDLRTSGSRSLLQDPISIPDVEIVPGGNTLLPIQRFAVSTDGQFSFFADAQSIAGNCEPASTGGADLTGFEFTLRDDEGRCTPSELRIRGENQPERTFSITCDTPSTMIPCVEKDQLMRVSARSGAYQFVLRARIRDSVDCRSRATGFQLPGGGLEHSLGVLKLESEKCASL